MKVVIDIVNIINPGTINAPYGTSFVKLILLPIAVPNTIKYKAVDNTGDTKLCIKVLNVRDISNI